MMRMIVFILSQYSICVDRHDPIDGEPSFKINRTSAASIEKPIHNVKVPMNEAEASSKPARRREPVSSFLERQKPKWWSLSGSNR
ncbi:hypothetical protein [Sphingopyxis sp. NJF-3]